MSEQKKQDSFQYTYSAREPEEVKKIRSKYLPKEESKLETLRRLDAKAAEKATVVALALGSIGALILGQDMSYTMVWTDRSFIPGITIGLVGIVLVAVAYPVYTRTLKKERERLVPEILRLTDELMK